MMAVPLTPLALELLRGKNLAWVATSHADGWPQVTPVWVDTDGTNVIFNTAEGRVKTKNLRRDARVSVAVGDAAVLERYVSIKGRVIEMRTEGANEQMNTLSQKYKGTDFVVAPGQVRVVVVIEPEKIGDHPG
jgi:PPOX class probable F420-dependent enzyme